MLLQKGGIPQPENGAREALSRCAMPDPLAMRGVLLLPWFVSTTAERKKLEAALLAAHPAEAAVEEEQALIVERWT